MRKMKRKKTIERFLFFDSYRFMPKTPTVKHQGNKTIVHYPATNKHNSNVNRPAQVIRNSRGTTCVYKK